MLAATGPGTALPEALERATVEALSAPDARAVDGLEQTRALLRAAVDDPALRAVWYRVNQESEERLVPVVARLAGADADPLEVRLAAAAATDAIRIALETWAATDAAADGPGSPPSWRSAACVISWAGCARHSPRTRTDARSRDRPRARRERGWLRAGGAGERATVAGSGP